MTPFHLAALHGRKSTLNWLIDHLARAQGNLEANHDMSFRQHLKAHCASFLVGRSSLAPSLNKRDTRGRSALHYAVCRLAFDLHPVLCCYATDMPTTIFSCCWAHIALFLDCSSKHFQAYAGHPEICTELVRTEGVDSDPRDHVG